MAWIAAVAEWSVLAFFALLLAVQLLMHEVGYWFGRWSRTSAEAQPEGVGIIVSGMLGLLAFVLALTLSFASNRFSERRIGTLAESNAIGTAWLRAEAIGDPRGEEIARLLEQYTQVRRDFVLATRNSPQIEEMNRRTGELQSVIWGHMAAIAREKPNPVTTSLMSALNDMFDMSASERFAFEQRLPPQIFWLLIGMAMMGNCVLGYQLGLRGRSMRLLVIMLIIMWTAVITGILDLAAARLGSFRSETAVYEWTLQGFKGGISVPPLPPVR